MASTNGAAAALAAMSTEIANVFSTAGAPENLPAVLAPAPPADSIPAGDGIILPAPTEFLPAAPGTTPPPPAESDILSLARDTAITSYTGAQRAALAQWAQRLPNDSIKSLLAAYEFMRALEELDPAAMSNTKIRERTDALFRIPKYHELIESGKFKRALEDPEKGIGFAPTPGQAREAWTRANDWNELETAYLSGDPNSFFSKFFYTDESGRMPAVQVEHLRGLPQYLMGLGPGIHELLASPISLDIQEKIARMIPEMFPAAPEGSNADYLRRAAVAVLPMLYARLGWATPMMHFMESAAGAPAAATGVPAAASSADKAELDRLKREAAAREKSDLDAAVANYRNTWLSTVIQEEFALCAQSDLIKQEAVRQGWNSQYLADIVLPAVRKRAAQAVESDAMRYPPILQAITRGTRALDKAAAQQALQMRLVVFRDKLNTVAPVVLKEIAERYSPKRPDGTPGASPVSSSAPRQVPGSTPLAQPPSGPAGVVNGGNGGNGNGSIAPARKTLDMLQAEVASGIAQAVRAAARQ